MPDPGSHAFDVKRTRLRGELERDAVPSVPDQHADEQARAQLVREHPPRRPDDPRAAGPTGAGGGSEERGGIEMRTPAFNDHDTIPARYTMQGENVSPALEWSGVPDDARELALLCEDPDAPSGNFVHWAVTGIEPHATSSDCSRSTNGWIWHRTQAPTTSEPQLPRTPWPAECSSDDSAASGGAQSAAARDHAVARRGRVSSVSALASASAASTVAPP
jgi:hypothetical protein